LKSKLTLHCSVLLWLQTTITLFTVLKNSTALAGIFFALFKTPHLKLVFLQKVGLFLNDFIPDTLFLQICFAKSLQSCLTLCNPVDSSPPGCPVPGILQARTLEWVAISFSNAWKWKVKVKSLSRVRLLVTPWTAAYQAPPSMRFSRQEYWSGLPLPSLEDWLAKTNK